METKKRFFCLRGFMKSGTNWLGGLLDRHPEVSCRGEYHWELVLKPIVERSPLMLQTQTDDAIRETLKHVRVAIRRTMAALSDPAATVIGDRTPHTISPIVLPVPHIVIIRDGRDILVSRAFHLFNSPNYTQLFKRSKTAAATLAEFQANKWFFRDHPERLLENREVVETTAHWWVDQLEKDRKVTENQPHLPVRFVRYEDLHLRTQEISDELFEFLGVDPQLAPPIEGELKPGFENESPNQFFRKGQAGDWVNYFTDQVKEQFKNIAGEELVRQGYENDLEW
ncbi:MAG: sulfotransferase domain-containing protein [Pirellulaceae bacterium]|jgi:hypothetical protein|nr:sulfotransferase domain-containing protein [Pirellulaceae bacterium]